MKVNMGMRKKTALGSELYQSNEKNRHILNDGLIGKN